LVIDKADYREWLEGQKIEECYGLLWIKGKVGTGRSPLIKKHHIELKIIVSHIPFLSDSFSMPEVANWRGIHYVIYGLSFIKPCSRIVLFYPRYTQSSNQV
jgi:hypothetical protein